MVTLVLSVALTAWSALTLWLISTGGRAERIGFLVGIACQGLWITFDLWAGAYGLLPLALVYAPMYWRGYRRHRAAKVSPILMGVDTATPGRVAGVAKMRVSEVGVKGGSFSMGYERIAPDAFDPSTITDKDPLTICTKCQVYTAGPKCWKCGGETSTGTLPPRDSSSLGKKGR